MVIMVKMMMIKHSILIMIFILMVGCVKYSHEDTELGAMDRFWNVLGSGDISKLEEKK